MFYYKNKYMYLFVYTFIKAKKNCSLKNDSNRQRIQKVKHHTKNLNI